MAKIDKISSFGLDELKVKTKSVTVYFAKIKIQAGNCHQIKEPTITTVDSTQIFGIKDDF